MPLAANYFVGRSDVWLFKQRILCVGSDRALNLQDLHLIYNRFT